MLNITRALVILAAIAVVAATILLLKPHRNSFSRGINPPEIVNSSVTSPHECLNLSYSRSFAQDRQMDVYVPGANSNGVCILFIHGGGFISGTRSHWTSTAQYFQSLGYTCATMDYRLAPQYQYPAPIEDARLAVSFLRSHAADYRFNPNTLAVVGSSAGGYLALMLDTLRPSDTVGLSPEMSVQDTRPEAIILECPVSTFQRMGKYSWVTEYLGVREQTNGQIYRMASPVNQIRGSIGDVLIIHGTIDPLIPIAQSESLSHKILATGGYSELVRLPGVGHGFGGGTSTDAQQTANIAINSFLRRRFFLK